MPLLSNNGHMPSPHGCVLHELKASYRSTGNKQYTLYDTYVPSTKQQTNWCAAPCKPRRAQAAPTLVSIANCNHRTSSNKCESNPTWQAQRVPPRPHKPPRDLRTAPTGSARSRAPRQQHHPHQRLPPQRVECALPASICHRSRPRHLEPCLQRGESSGTESAPIPHDHHDHGLMNVLSQLPTGGAQ